MLQLQLHVLAQLQALSHQLIKVLLFQTQGDQRLAGANGGRV